ncbi:AI-2E family transporter [Halobaculum halobium]|uniref:AI-2E family transporter n=1 Tax=Halobaculum halobium TaxID=3032281 RepID=A0ABD5TBG7_9EURY|nr:AI-2E family transporter [Halobaculum sp. SYNS20]
MTLQRRFLLVATAVVVAAAVAVVAPVAQYVLFGVLLAYVLRPVHDRLAPSIGERPSAAVLVSVSTATVLAPIAVVIAVALRELLRLRAALAEGTVELETVELLAAAGGIDLRAELDQLTRRGLESGLGRVLDLFGGLTEVLVGLTVLLFVVYYLLADGDRLLAWTGRVIPLDGETQTALRRDLDRITWGVVVGNIAVAAVHGVLTGLVFGLVGISNVVFWVVVTTLLSLLPLIGASVVWLPMTAFLFMAGRPVDAAVVFAFGTAVISLSDNYLRPVITGHEARVSPGVMVVGIFGGVLAFGFAGLFVGPIVLAFAAVLVETLVEVDEPAGASQETPGAVEADGETDGDVESIDDGGV